MGSQTKARAALRRGIRLFREGRSSEALRCFDHTMTLALEAGDSPIWDRAFCNRFAMEIEGGEAAESLPELKQILLRTSDPENGFLAAYNIARYYDLAQRKDRALFYARIAHGRCRGLNRREWRGWTHNLLGNLLLADSTFEEACQHYERALHFIDQGSNDRAMVLDNLGYCRVIQGRYDEGLTMLYSSIRQLIGAGAEHLQAAPRLSLCYAHLELGRLRDALRHGQRAMDLGSVHGDDMSVKNALFLLGEIYQQLGHEDIARSYFVRLQQRFYPSAGQVPDLLLAIDVRSLVNLKA